MNKIKKPCYYDPENVIECNECDDNRRNEINSWEGCKYGMEHTLYKRIAELERYCRRLWRALDDATDGRDDLFVRALSVFDELSLKYGPEEETK